MATTSGFDLPILQAVSDWQRGGSPKQKARRGRELKAQAARLPVQFRTCNVPCFRQMALPKGGVWALLGDNKLDETISAWTVDFDTAKTIKNGVPPQGQGLIGTIMSITPIPEQVVANLDALYRDSDFNAAMLAHKNQIVGYYEGAGRYKNTQREVVLEVESVNQSNVYSFGEHSSPFEKLAYAAACKFFRRPPSSIEFNQFLASVEHVRDVAGPDWIDQDATQRVLERMQEPAAVLREVKRVQAQAKK